MNRPACQCTRCLWARTGRALAEVWLRQIIDQALAEAGESAPLAEKPAPPASNPFAA